VKRQLKNTHQVRISAAPKVPHDITSGASPPAEHTWPFVERRKGERRQGDRRRAARPDVPSGLDASVCTVRERQILRLLVQGMTNRQIAQSLGIAEDTVKKHLHHVYKKLGVRRRTLLIVDLSRLFSEG
jgi:DNA-binding CsgD family transcriptional regulator